MLASSSSSSIDYCSNNSSNSSSSLSSSSISSSSSTSNPSFSFPPKSMEEVWKDITITSLPSTPFIPHHPSPTSHHFRGFILQDFLKNNNNNNQVENISTKNNNKNPSSNILQFLSPISQNTKTTTQEYQFLDDNHNHDDDDHHQLSKQGNSLVPGLVNTMNNAGYDALVSTSVLTTFGGGGLHGGDGGGGGGAVSNNRKRISESGGGGIQGVEESVERRNKRMIKNRESAARSRARKQAYITELEMEIAHLSKENAMLRKQQRQVVESPPDHQLPKKYVLHRTSTAPF